jgi:hypothetical protein
MVVDQARVDGLSCLVWRRHSGGSWLEVGDGGVKGQCCVVVMLSCIESNVSLTRGSWIDMSLTRGMFPVNSILSPGCSQSKYIY